MHGFYWKLGSASALSAKLWALRLGTKLAQHLKLNWVMLKLDSEVVTRMVNSSKASNAYLQPLLHEIIAVLQLPNWRTSVSHVYN